MFSLTVDTYPPLASVAMDALERWHQLHPHELEPWLPVITMSLSDYISEVDKAELSDGSSEVGTSESSNSRESLSRLQLARLKKARAQASQAGPFEVTQVRVQKFLGQIGSFNHNLVHDLDLLQVAGTGGLAWDSVDRIQFTLPFRDDKFDIWLDPLLCRVVELAVSSSDRRTKVTASELLQALCLLMLGNSAKGPLQRKNEKDQSVYLDKIYRRLLPAVLQLAVDVEQVTRQLFSEFAKQLIHWFTSNQQRENPETMTLLEAILDGLVDAESGSLREFCAACFGEFMSWSVRHAPPESNAFVNVASMLRRLYNRMDHPNPYKRLGAAMAAYRIYPVLRGNSSIVDRYIFEIIFFCIKSLRLAESDDVQTGTVKQMNKTLDSFMKLVERNISALERARKDRPMFLTLDDFLDWLLHQTAQLQEASRTRCMSLLSFICRLLPAGSLASWFRVKLEQGTDIESIIGVFIYEEEDRPFDVWSMEEARHQLAVFTRSLHWYEWALRQEILTTKELISTTSSNVVVKSFLRRIHSAPESDSVWNSLTLGERDSYGKLVRGAVFRLLSFTRQVLDSEFGTGDVGVFLPGRVDKERIDMLCLEGLIPLNEPGFLELLCFALLRPRELGFVVADSQIFAEEIAKLSVGVIQRLSAASTMFSERLTKRLVTLFGDRRYDLSSFDFNLEEGGSGGGLGVEDAMNLLKGYQQLHLSGSLLSILGKSRAKLMGEKLMTIVYRIGRECPPLLESLASEMLKLSLALGASVQNLVELCLDEAAIHPFSESSGQQTQKLTSGGIFYLNFRRIIVQRLKFAFKDCLPLILSAAVRNSTARLLLNAVLDDQINSVEQGSDVSRGSFLKEMFHHLHSLQPCSVSNADLADKQLFLEILQKVLVLDLSTENVLQREELPRNYIQDSFISFLDGGGSVGDVDNSARKEADFALKTYAMVLIPLLLKPAFTEEFHSRLCSSLTRVVSDHLLVRESDLPEGSNQRAMYMRMLSRLLEAVSLSCSVILLEVIFPLLLDPPKFALRKLTDSIDLFSQNIGEGKTAGFNLCLRVLGDATKIPRLRRAIIERVFVSLVNAAPPDFVAKWYATRIKSFNDILGKNVDSLDAEKEEESLTVKACHYMLVELLFTRVDAPLIKEHITPSVPNAPLMKLTMSEARAKNDPVTYLYPENTKLWRDLHISAYKSLAAITLRTQEQEKVFGVLFKEGPSGMIWQHLIDTEKVYGELPVETQQFSSASQTVRGMRAERKARKSSQGVSGTSTLSSQYVVNIGLSQEPAVISSFVGKAPTEGDSGSLQVTSVDEDGTSRGVSDIASQEKSNLEEAIDMVPSDQDDFDQHPCMGVLLRLIEELHSRFRNGHREMPEWMKAMHSSLHNAGTHINIRLFLTKVVTRTWRVFAPHALAWFVPLVQTVLVDPERSGGMTFHYILRDICITVLQWNLSSPPDPGVASAFVSHLIRVSPHTSGLVLRANVDIIRVFLDSWKKDIRLDKLIILKELVFGGRSASGTDRSVKMHRILGLQLFGALAASGLQLYDPASDLFPEKDLYQALLENVSFRAKEIYEASGELIGILLKQRHEAAQEFRRPIDEKMLEVPLKQILLKFCRESNLDCFLNVLNKITFRFPQYVESFSSLLVDLVPKLPGVFRVIALDIFLRFPTCLRGLLNMLLPTFTNVLTHRDEFAQLKCLQLLMELMKDVPDQKVQQMVLPVLHETFPTHENVDCRQHYYDLLIYFHSTNSSELDKQIARSLVAGLTDSAESIRSSLQKFWNGTLSQDLRERLSQMICQMYDPSVEERWAQFSNVLLLKLCEESVDYKRKIFNAPLSDCEFHDYTIDTAYVGGSLPMTPLFSQSQAVHSTQDSRSQAASLSQQEEEEDESRYPRQAGMIRASYSLTQTQTQDMSAGYPQATQESSLYAMSRKPSGTPSQAASQELGISGDSSLGLRRRIPLANSARSQVIRSVVNANKRREARAAQQASERANKVRIMRRYRTGELPDIEITHEDILAPLSSLSEKDGTFARLFLTLICRTVYAQSGGRQKDRLTNVKGQIAEGIGKALEKTSNGSSFVGCIEAICLEDPTIWIQPKLVGRASLKSANFHSGILVLEGEILHESNKDTPAQCSSKRQKGQAGKVTNDGVKLQEAWLELARLYKELGEEDIVLSVYQKKLTEKSISHKALEAQLGGDPRRALVLYDQALDTFDEESGDQPSQVEQDIWYNQRLACLLDLNRWQLLLEDTLTQVRSDDSADPDLEKLWDPNIEDPYLGLFVRGAAKVSTYRSLAEEFIQASLKDSRKREVVMNEYGTQLATLAVANDQFDRARFYISQCYRSFRKQWTALHPLATGARHRQVEKLQKIVELEEFLDLMTNQQREQFPRKIIEWRHRWPSSKLDGVEAWDDIVQNRLVFFLKFQGLVNTLVSTESQHVEATPKALASKLEKERAHIFHEAARGLTKVGAYDAAQSYMEEYMAAHQGTVTEGALDCRFFKGLVKLRCLQANRVKVMHATEATEMLQQVLSYVTSTARKSWLGESEDWKVGLKVLEATISSQLAWMKIDQLSNVYGTLHTVDDSVSLLGGAYCSYSDTASKFSSGTCTRDSSKASRQMAKVLINFGLFCDELLKASKSVELSDALRSRILQGDSTAGLPPASSYPSVIVKNMLDAVSLNTSVRAQHGLARVLSLVGQHPETHVQFASAIKQVPSWVFIPWIPQMLAVMDEEVGGILIPLLEDVARLYPQALYFPFHVSEKDFGPLGRKRTRRLATLLKSFALEGMVRGLEDLTFPEQRFRDGLSQMKSCIIAGDKEKALKVFAEVYDDCLDVDAMRKWVRGAGEYNLKFARDWSKRVMKALGENGNKLAKMDEKKFMSAVGNLLANLQKVMQNLQTGVMSLGHLSKWMAQFDQLTQIAVGQQENSSHNEGSSGSRSVFGGKKAACVEIPGQYSGFREPKRDSHVKLVGFDQTLVCLSSKQRPKILTMRGSDEKEYKFVVKGGEDLRLDQRIEQLFEVMNSILQRDPQAARRGLAIRTYAVVPVSKSCGLLQFVENTCVLEDVVKDGLLCKVPSLAREGKNAPLNFLHNLRAQYHDWIMKRGGPSQNPPECYRNLYQKASCDEVTQKIRNLETQIPWDTFRAGVARWATSAESFLALRSQFAKSLSVISICGYVAGVGDRHLANTLVDMRSGSLIPIDFGYSFGTGVILLPVPELIPFRLTNQLVNFLLPLDALGLLRTDMVHTLSALHARREVISAVMDVFVKEPLVDWKNEAMKTVGNFKDKKDDSVMEPSSFEQQYVELKVENAQRKLELWSPAAITISELKSSVHANKPYSQALEKIVRGSPDRNFRARVSGHVCQSVREQVDCLIDQATDPNLLGRIWQAALPWKLLCMWRFEVILLLTERFVHHNLHWLSLAKYNHYHVGCDCLFNNDGKISNVSLKRKELERHMYVSWIMGYSSWVRG
ncbi:hypothetical protein R1flu_012762 [Riccia fluitans]|uniref:DNA-dependent protein kinase catalytic subunit n=1 Tax=Riccia fluitans TaxID=41844 RepID=A0ABD1ZBQ3_9MARC